MASTATTTDAREPTLKLRMARNSLFAVLLRSPWWISFLVVLVFVAATQALLPAEYRTLGSLGALPFFVIGCIAFWRQLRAPSPGQAQALLASVAAMPWPQFEAALRRGFAREGWDVQPGRAGADLTLRRQGRTSLVWARRWKAARIGEEALQPLAASMRDEGAGGVYVALGEPSPQARRVAREAGIELLQQDALVKLLNGVLG